MKDLKEYKNIRFVSVNTYTDPELKDGEQILEIIPIDSYRTDGYTDERGYYNSNSIPLREAKLMVGTPVGSDFAKFSENIRSLEADLQSARKVNTDKQAEFDKTLNEKENHIRMLNSELNSNKSYKKLAEQSRDEAVAKLRLLEGDLAKLRSAIGDIKFNEILGSKE